MVKKFYKNYKKPKTSNHLNEPESVKKAVYLIIVESPSKCKKIESYLGSQYCCISSKGHIRNIKGLSSIDSLNEYETKYSIMDEKKTHVDWMKTVIDQFDKAKIYLATDDDREGEAIAWHICEVFQLPVETTLRIKFHEVTEPAIKRSICNPTILDMNKVNAQKARQILDMIVGYKISPMLWKYIYRDKENSLSAGRCQTPALRLVYENEEEIQNMVIEQKYQIKGSFYPKKIEFHLNKPLNTEKEVYQFLEESKYHNHCLTVKPHREHVKMPPKPFNTSLLLQVASNCLHMNPKETMHICQELYQEGHITYMRTESQKYSNVFLEEATEYIYRMYEENLGENLENLDTSNPHEAIRITHIEIESVKMDNSRANTLYKLIRKNTIESCMTAAMYTHVPLVLSAPMNYNYTHTIELPVALGWKKIEKESHENLLLYILSHLYENIKYNHIKSEISIHGKRSHYTEASLIKKLEDTGIGRPSTFATIVETIIERGYVVKKDVIGQMIQTNEMSLIEGEIEINETTKYIGNEKGKLVIQPIGIIVSEFLTNHYSSLFDYEYTKKMEQRLDEISFNSESWSKICKECENEIDGCSSLKKPTYKLKDNDNYDIVYEKYGFVLRKTLENGKYEYENIRTDIDIHKIRSGNYSLEEIIQRDAQLIHIDDAPALIKSGPYGKYLQFENENVSFKTLHLDETETDESTIIKSFVEKEDNSLIRKLNDELSIRNGKYGAYIYYKTKDMKKPKFYNLNAFKESYRFCKEETIFAWIKEKYNI